MSSAFAAHEDDAPRNMDSEPRLVLVHPDDPPSGETPEPVHLRAERAAHHLGVQVTDVERLPFDLSVLENEGAFLNVDARNFGLLDRRLDWRALGVTLPGGSNLAFRQPRCGLVPERYRLPLLRPAGQAYAALQKYSYHFRLIETVFETPSYRWIPWRAWTAFERDFQRARANLQAALDTYQVDYASIRETVVDTFRQLAADSARRLAATQHPVPADFEDAVVQEVVAVLPAPELLRDKLTLRFRVGVMQLGSEMLAEQHRAAVERKNLEAVEGDRRLAERQQAAQERAVQESLWAERERIRQHHAADEEERRREAAVKEQLRQLKLQAARERLDEALSPLEEGAAQLHSAVFEAASAIRASLQKHDALRGSSARKARDLARWFRVMNWSGDEQLEALVHELEQLACAPVAKKRKRAPGPIDRVLGDIIDLTYSSARDLAQPSRMAALEL